MNRVVNRLLAFCVFFALASFAGSQAISQIGVTAATSAAAGNLLDINTATPAQFKLLKGIGDAYTKRIIDGRPYTAKNQLVTRGIVPQATYDGIKEQVVARAVKR